MKTTKKKNLDMENCKPDWLIMDTDGTTYTLKECLEPRKKPHHNTD